MNPHFSSFDSSTFQEVFFNFTAVHHKTSYSLPTSLHISSRNNCSFRVGEVIRNSRRAQIARSMTAKSLKIPHSLGQAQTTLTAYDKNTTIKPITTTKNIGVGTWCSDQRPGRPTIATCDKRSSVRLPLLTPALNL